MKTFYSRIIPFILVLCLLWGIAGCKGGEVKKASGENAPSGGGIVKELKIGTTRPNDVFNAMAEDGAFGKMNYNSFTQAPFVELDENNKIKPHIMQMWTISEDNKELTFTFPKDIFWHDGKPVTAEDVKFTFEYLKNVRKSSYLAQMKDIKIVKDNVATITFDEPAAFAFLNKIAFVVYLYPKHIWENVNNPKEYTGKDAVIGCGPYKYISYDPDSQTSYYEAVDNYFKGELTVKKVSVRSFDTHEALVMALKNGQVDAMYDYSNPLDATMAPSIMNVQNIDAGASDNTGNFQLAFGFNKTPSNKLEFRQAVSYALDYGLLARTIGGDYGVIPGKGIIASPNKGFDAALPKLAQDVEKAKKILEEAGYKDKNGDGYRELPDGSPMDILITPQNNPTRQQLYLRMAEIIGENLKAIGVKSRLDQESVRNKDVWTKRVQTNRDYDLHICYTSPGIALFDTAAYYMMPSPFSTWGTCNINEYVEAYKKMKVSKNYDEYGENVKNLQKIHAEQIPAVGLCWDKAFFPYRTDKYAGWVNYPGWGVINSQTWYKLRTK